MAQKETFLRAAVAVRQLTWSDGVTSESISIIMDQRDICAAIEDVMLDWPEACRLEAPCRLRMHQFCAAAIARIIQDMAMIRSEREVVKEVRSKLRSRLRQWLEDDEQKPGRRTRRTTRRPPLPEAAKGAEPTDVGLAMAIGISVTKARELRNRDRLSRLSFFNGDWVDSREGIFMKESRSRGFGRRRSRSRIHDLAIEGLVDLHERSAG